MKIQQIIVVLMIIFISIGNYACNSPQSTKDIELVKQINGMLDKLYANPEAFDSHLVLEEDPGAHIDAIAKNCQLLIENSDIALPVMLKRLYANKFKPHSFGIYFIVFRKVEKSGELIPYIADYIASMKEEETKYPDKDGLYGPQVALSAAQVITSLKNFFDENRPFFDQRKEIADKLTQWYAEYKKLNAKK